VAALALLVGAAAAGVRRSAVPKGSGAPPGPRSFNVRRPDGSKMPVGYNVPSPADFKDSPKGVLDFELFPVEEAQKLISLMEEWDVFYSERGFDSLWTQTPDNIDKVPENQFNLFGVHPDGMGTDTDEMTRSYRRKGWKAHGVARPFSDLVKALCINVYEPYLRDVKGYEENAQCNSIFFRRYLVESGRTKIVAHEDEDRYTFNAALSDGRGHTGGSLYMCHLMPQRFQAFLSLHVVHSDTSSPRWLELMEPYKNLDAQTFETNVCAPRQSAQGRVAGHTSSRLHGVEPIRGEGVRYSLIAFMGTKQKDEMKSTPAQEKLLPMHSRHAQAYIHALEMANLHFVHGLEQMAKGNRSYVEDLDVKFNEGDSFLEDVLPSLEHETFLSQTSIVLALMRLASQMLSPALTPIESLLQSRREAGARVLAALASVLARHTGHPEVLAEACGLMHLLECLGEGDGTCGGIAALCPEGLKIPTPQLPDRSPAVMQPLFERCARSFYLSSKVQLTEPIDPECAKLVDYGMSPRPGDWVMPSGTDYSEFAPSPEERRSPGSPEL
jgi:hypothetical protein